jgi:TIR domain
VKVFISWSGDRSKALAEELRDWLPTIVQSLEPFISTQDVPLGGRGLNVLASELQDCSFGIVCLTQENKQGPWIHFEAGALSKVIDTSRVVPLLLDLKVSDLTGPLVQFQAVSIEDRDGVFSLVKALAEHSDPPIAEARLHRLFDAFWPDLEEKVSYLRDSGNTAQSQEVRSEREILEEILLLTRSAERQLASTATARTREEATPQPASSYIVTDRPENDLYRVLRRLGAAAAQAHTDGDGIHFTIRETSREMDRDEVMSQIWDFVEKNRVAVSIKGGPFEAEEFFAPTSLPTSS